MASVPVNILTGVPVFRVAELVERCIVSLTSEPADILVIDNAADWEVKQALKRHIDKLKIISTDTNTYCNGGWNLILEYGITRGYDIIGLGSSDATLQEGWQSAIRNRAAKASKEVWIASLVPSNEEVTKVDS